MAPLDSDREYCPSLNLLTTLLVISISRVSVLGMVLVSLVMVLEP